jgi:hypothetical protein
MPIVNGFRVQNRYVQYATLFGAVIVGVILSIAGFGISVALLMAFLILLIVVFGYLGELAGSLIFIFLLHQIGAETSNLLNILFNTPKTAKMLEFLVSLGYIKGMMAVFFLLSTIRMITGAVKIFHLNVSNNVSA